MKLINFPAIEKLVNAACGKITIETSTSYRDPEGGCGCGHDCDRNPGTSCPIARMYVFEVVLQGFDPANPPTHHLVKWIKARSAKLVNSYLKTTGLYAKRDFKYPLRRLPARSVSFGDGLDLVLTDAERWLGDGGPTTLAELPPSICSYPRPARVGIWDEDEDYPVADWQDEVANNDTRLGYWEWVHHRKESDRATT